MEFLDNSKQSFYPFDTDTELRSINEGIGTFLLASNFLLDMFIYYHNDIYLQSIERNFSSIIVIFSDIESKTEIGRTIISLTNLLTPIRATIIGTKGLCIYGDGLAKIDFFGKINFHPDKTKLLSKVVKRSIDKLDSITEGNTETKYTTSVKFYNGYNIELKKDKNKINVFANPGSGLGFFCGNIESEDCEGCVRTINGISPNENHLFKIETENHVTLENFPDIHKIIVGTQIPIERLECLRSGEKGRKGAQGPQGARGGTGLPAPDVCVTCLICNSCNTCEKQCGVCNNAENCIRCENCNTAQNLRTQNV